MFKGSWTYTTLAGRIKSCAPCLHDKGVIDGDDENLSGVLEGGVVDVAGDMCARASGAYLIVLSIAIQLQVCIGREERTESGWNADNDTLSGQFLGDVDLVAG